MKLTFIILEIELVLVQQNWQLWFNLWVTAYCPERLFTFPGSSVLAAILTVGLQSNKTLWNWVRMVPIFLKLFSQHFSFQGSINRLSCSQSIAFIKISHFSWSYIE